MITKPRLFVRFSMGAALALLAVSANAQKPAELFTDAGPAQNAARKRVDSEILKRRIVRVNFANLAPHIRKGGGLKLNLFEDVVFDGVIQKVEERGKNNYTLSGHLEGDDFSTFTLGVNEDVLIMNVRTKDQRLYQIRYLENGFHEARQINEAQFAPCLTKAEHAASRQGIAKVAPDVAADQQGDSGATIDVMIVYTAAARIEAGGTPAIQNLINVTVAEANTAYQQSLINPRINLVYLGEISYTESTMSTNLARLANTSDGFMDSVHALRNTYGADLVSLWTADDGGNCGLAYLMDELSPSFSSLGFGVVAVDCAGGNLSFAHELAHNMGCHHDRANALNQDGTQDYGLNSYSFGWRFNGTNGLQYRTIMAYSPGSRVPRFSNPNVNYVGTPTGIAIGQVNESYNARTINNSAFTISNFRQSVATNTPPSIVIQPQPQHVSLGAIATFTVSASGTAPLLYYWRKGGTNISGATTNNFYSITNVQNSHAGIYSVVVSNAYGTAISSNAALTINVPIALGDALDTVGVTWSSGGNVVWAGQNTTTHDGTDAAQSGLISHSQQSWFEATFTGPGTLTYWCKVSSEAGWDLLRFYLGGIPQSTNSGEVDWTQKTVNIPAGSHVCRWTYSKDSSDDYPIGQDRAWVDQVTFTPPSGISLATALDNAGFAWLTSGNGLWLGQNSISHDGVDAAQSGAITHNQYTLLRTTVTGPGTLSFWWKVSSETNYDWLDFFVDSTAVDPGISGTNNWSARTFSIPSGSHTLTWQYSKDVSDTSGDDKGWIDQIVYSGGSSFLASTARQTNGQFQFQFSGLPGASYTVQASTNLINWATLTNVVSSNVSHIFLDPAGTTNFKNRFYRIVSP